jgi:tetratricopeptide (TPR) repeat protein
VSDDRPLFVARESDVAALRAHFDAAVTGDPRFVRLTAEFGGGRRALATELMRSLRSSSEDPLLWRVGPTDQEQGLQWLLRMYAGLVASISSEPLRRGRVEMLLNGQLPQQTKRVQGWYQQFVASLKESKVDPATGQVQLRIPQDNPLIGLVELTLGVARKMPIVLEIQAPWMVHSVLVAQFLEALLDEARTNKAKLLVLLYDEPAGQVRDASHPAPLLDLYQRRADRFHEHVIAPWGAEEAAAYLASRGVSSDAARLAAITRGRPGFLAELTDILEKAGRLGDDLSGVTLADLVPMSIDEDDLSVPDAPPAEGQRKHASIDDAPRVVHLAALLGQVFPASLLAEMGGFERESIDDLLDAMGDLFEELQFNEQMGTWIYRFKTGCWREGVLERNDTAEGKGLTRGVAQFMERFLVPRGQAYMVRTARLWAEGEAPQRAVAMRALALTNDAQEVWGMGYELMRYYDEVPWTDALRRSVLTTLLDHLVQAGPIPSAEQVLAESTAWAAQKDDRELQGWLLLTGSKLDARRQDLFRARDRANDAIKIFESLELRSRVSEVYAHIASIELQDGRSAEAIAATDKALEYGSREQVVQPAEGAEAPEGGDAAPTTRRVVLPAILAQSELVRGVVARRDNKFDQAITHFRQANEIAGNTGHGALALEAGIAMGEAMAAGGQTEPARDVLRRVLTATRQVNALPRERAAAQLLSQIEGQLRNFDAAAQLAQRVLQISQQIKFEAAMPFDLYNAGFFLLAQNKGAEAMPFLEQSAARLQGQDNHALMKDLWYHLGLACLQAGQIDKAKSALQRSLRPLQAARDSRKLVSAMEQLAAIEHRGGNVEAAKRLLNDAIVIAREADLNDEKRALKKRLESISG